MDVKTVVFPFTLTPKTAYEADFSVFPLCLQDKMTKEEFNTISGHITSMLTPINQQLEEVRKYWEKWMLGMGIATLPTGGLCWAFLFVPLMKYNDRLNTVNNNLGKDLKEYCNTLNKTWELRGIQWVYKSASTVIPNGEGTFTRLATPMIEVAYKMSTTPMNSTEGSQS